MKSWDEIEQIEDTQERPRILILFTADQIQSLDSGIICECWDHRTFGRVKRAWLAQFTKEEREKAALLYRKYIHNWNLVKGIPLDGVYMATSTYLFIRRMADFFATT